MTRDIKNVYVEFLIKEMKNKGYGMERLGLMHDVEIVSMTMVPVKVPDTYRRKTNMQMDIKTLDIIGEQYSNVGVGGLSADFMARQLGGAMTYDQAPTERFSLPNGNDIYRFNFKIITRNTGIKTPQYKSIDEYVITGYCDTSDMSNGGVLNDNMVFYFTHISGATYTYHSNGHVTSKRGMNADILRDPFTDITTPTATKNKHMRMTKADVLVGLTTKEYNEGMHSERALMVNTLGDNTLLAPNSDSNVYETLSGSLTSYLSTMTEGSSDLLSSKTDDLTSAANMASTGSLHTCAFMNALMLHTGIGGVSSITLDDLKQVFPDIESKTEVFVPSNIEASPSDIFLQGNDAGAASLLTSTAAMAVDLTLASMVLYNISTISFTISNMTLTGEPVHAITGVTTPRITVDSNELMGMVNKFLEHFVNTSWNALTQNMFNISLSMNISQISATVTIEIDGYGTDSIVIPIVTHNLQTPAMATMSEFKTNTDSIGSVLDLMSINQEPVETKNNDLDLPEYKQ